MCRRLALLVVLLLAAAPPACPARTVSVRRSATAIRISTARARAEITLSPYRLTLATRSGTPLTTEADGGGPFWERGGASHGLGAVTDVARLPDGVRLTVATDEGSPATVTPMSPMAPPGNGSNIKPTITPAKSAKKYQACCGRPSGAGMSASAIAIPTGATCFQVIFTPPLLRMVGPVQCR